MKFTLEPRYRSRDKGDFVQISDMVLIKNVKTKCYMSIFYDVNKEFASKITVNPSLIIHKNTAMQKKEDICKIKDENPY